MTLLMVTDRDAIRQMMREGESKIELNKSAVRTERRSKHELVDEFKKGAKGARTALSSRRKEDADGLRSKSGDLSELRSQSIIETVRANRLARDGVPPPNMQALTTAPLPPHRCERTGWRATACSRSARRPRRRCRPRR